MGEAREQHREKKTWGWNPRGGKKREYCAAEDSLVNNQTRTEHLVIVV